MTSGHCARALSNCQVHHDLVEVQAAVKLDRLRLMGTFSRRHSCICDCEHSNSGRGFIFEKSCSGLAVFNVVANNARVTGAINIEPCSMRTGVSASTAR